MAPTYIEDLIISFSCWVSMISPPEIVEAWSAGAFGKDLVSRFLVWRDDTAEGGLLTTPLFVDWVRKADVLLHNGSRRSNCHAFMMDIRMLEWLMKRLMWECKGGGSEEWVYVPSCNWYWWYLYDQRDSVTHWHQTPRTKRFKKTGKGKRRNFKFQIGWQDFFSNFFIGLWFLVRLHHTVWSSSLKIDERRKLFIPCFRSWSSVIKNISLQPVICNKTQ